MIIVSHVDENKRLNFFKSVKKKFKVESPKGSEPKKKLNLYSLARLLKVLMSKPSRVLLVLYANQIKWTLLERN
jgi:hypothetical protein